MPNDRRWLVGKAGLTVFAAAVAVGLSCAENIDPDDDDSQYAYGENVGWLNAEQDTDGDGTPDQGIQVDDFELTGWMWGENLGWISLSCKNTSSCDAVPYGISNDGTGALSGYAWAENAGWISVSCANTASCGAADYGVTINPATGAFLGSAWAENTGWIRFESSGPDPFHLRTGWRCDPPPPVPSDPPTLGLTESGGGTVLSWSVVAGATGYDIVHGELNALRNHPGHFAAATLGCLGDNQTTASLYFAGMPPVGDGLWFLVRGVNCGGSGTYDTGAPSQLAPRDPDITVSGNDCP